MVKINVKKGRLRFALPAVVVVGILIIIFSNSALVKSQDILVTFGNSTFSLSAGSFGELEFKMVNVTVLGTRGYAEFEFRQNLTLLGNNATFNFSIAPINFIIRNGTIRNIEFQQYLNKSIVINNRTTNSSIVYKLKDYNGTSFDGCILFNSTHQNCTETAVTQIDSTYNIFKKDYWHTDRLIITHNKPNYIRISGNILPGINYWVFELNLTKEFAGNSLLKTALPDYKIIFDPFWNTSYNFQTNETLGTNQSAVNIVGLPYLVNGSYVNTKSLVDAGKMRSDCADFSVFNRTGIEMNYSFESYENTTLYGCNTNSTIIWAFPTLVETTNSTIMNWHYGLSTDTLLSNNSLGVANSALSNLTAWIPFGEGEGLSTKELVTGISGQFKNNTRGISWNQTSYIGNGINFNGTPGQRITFGDNDNWDFNFTNMTFMSWARINISGSLSNSIASKRVGGDGWLFMIENGNLSCQVGNNNFYAQNNSYNDSTWHHYACAVWNSSGSTDIRGYIDGKLVGNKSAGLAPFGPDMTANLTIGADSNNNAALFVGQVDYFMLFKGRALSDQEIAWMYQNQVGYGTNISRWQLEFANSPQFSSNFTNFGNNQTYRSSNNLGFQINATLPSGNINTSFESNVTGSYVNYTQLATSLFRITNVSARYIMNLTNIGFTNNSQEAIFGYRWFINSSASSNSTDRIFFNITQNISVSITTTLNGTNNNKWYKNDTAVNITAISNIINLPVNITMNITGWVIRTASGTTSIVNSTLIALNDSFLAYDNRSIILNATGYFDTVLNSNYSSSQTERNIFLDLSAPNFTGETQNSETSPGATSFTWRINATDARSNISIVLLEFDAVNYSMSGELTNRYTRSLLSLQPGTYNFRYHMNDSTDPNGNTSNIYTLTIPSGGSGGSGDSGGGGGGGPVVLITNKTFTVTPNPVGIVAIQGITSDTMPYYIRNERGDDITINIKITPPEFTSWVIKPEGSFTVPKNGNRTIFIQYKIPDSVSDGRYEFRLVFEGTSASGTLSAESVTVIDVGGLGTYLKSLFGIFDTLQNKFTATISTSALQKGTSQFGINLPSLSIPFVGLWIFIGMLAVLNMILKSSLKSSSMAFILSVLISIVVILLLPIG